MSGIDQFLSQHYGTVPSMEPSAEDTEKVAQAEMFLKLAANHGVDINQLNDAQVNELWDQAFQGEQQKVASINEQQKISAAQAEHARLRAEANEGQEKFAEADYMGRIMAHSYVNELRGIASEGGLNFMKTAQAAQTEVQGTESIDELAANYAVEKVAAAGYDANEAAQRISAVMVLGPDPSDKIAHVSGLENAVDVRSSELLELAGYPISWEGTPFEKQAKRGIPLPEDMVAENTSGSRPQLGKASKLREAGTKAKIHASAVANTAKKKAVGAGRWMAGHKKTTGGIAAGTLALGGGAAYLKHRSNKKKEEGEKDASVNTTEFDSAAAQLAVEKVASAGWDADEATNRINAIFSLGYEGDPSESEKVAAASTGEQALDNRACELLELAGYQINWPE